LLLITCVLSLDSARFTLFFILILYLQACGTSSGISVWNLLSNECILNLDCHAPVQDLLFDKNQVNACPCSITSYKVVANKHILMDHFIICVTKLYSCFELLIHLFDFLSYFHNLIWLRSMIVATSAWFNNTLVSFSMLWLTVWLQIHLGLWI